MTKSTKKVEEPTKTKKINSKHLLTGLDWLAKIIAGLFFIACTYGFVSQWLRQHQSQHDISIIGAIMVTAIALYLFLRKQ